MPCRYFDPAKGQIVGAGGSGGRVFANQQSDEVSAQLSPLSLP